jgi:hypothetical protein
VALSPEIKGIKLWEPSKGDRLASTSAKGIAD